MEALKEENNASKKQYKSLWNDDFKALDNLMDKTDARLDKFGYNVTKAIYLAALIQYVAIVVSLVCILKFMLHK